MTDKKVSFHLQHTAKPEHIRKIFVELSEVDVFDSRFLFDKLIDQGYSIQLGSGISRSLDVCKKLHLIETVDKTKYGLTPRGIACRKLALYRNEVFFDVMHFLFYATWKLGKEQDYWSWSYSKTCEMLWKSSPTEINKNRLFGELFSEASSSFPDLSPVVGTETIGAVTNWLKALKPQFLIDREKGGSVTTSREWFSIELAVLSIYYLYVVRGSHIGTPILLDNFTISQISPLCLSNTDRILFMIDLASKTYPFLKLHTGEWGNSAVLNQQIDVQTLV